ncbi:hypothetical protein A0126_16710 (plasmid) [Exiguobacterium sp. N4-1P]|uniref:hypothetical protein n=1 Tax=Exiguobacterium sp. N4-1P TaxID=2051906 RepID=UPI000B58F89E|nr:hypothetical protein [Exiguobacterium sp. N4-1P]ASI35219.1 hypothetical protein A0126_06435 [Exiguobacterium sp. N4-1P]ASI37232.1 hypothetical protein A0126_16710 [Exiguobacterium sp. N4-1P]
MKVTYSHEDLLALEDPFEYEVGLPIRIRELPASVIEEEIPDSREQLDRLLKDGYTLVIQKPRIPNSSVFAELPVIAENTIMKLYIYEANLCEDALWDALSENEYNRHWAYFLLKKIEGVRFELPYTQPSQQSLRLSHLGTNQLVYLQFETNQSVTCQWY